MAKKYEFLDERKREVNNPDMSYSYIYAPNATFINVESVDIIFCGQRTIVKTHCADIRRGKWYLKDGFIRDRKDNKFKYKTTFNSGEDLDIGFNPGLIIIEALSIGR